MNEIKWNPFENFSVSLSRLLSSLSYSRFCLYSEDDYNEGRQCDIIKLHDNENLLLTENLNEFDNFISNVELLNWRSENSNKIIFTIKIEVKVECKRKNEKFANWKMRPHFWTEHEKLLCKRISIQSIFFQNVTETRWAITLRSMKDNDSKSANYQIPKTVCFHVFLQQLVSRIR